MLVNHSTNLEHYFNFYNRKVINKEINLEEIFILEMIEIF